MDRKKTKKKGFAVIDFDKILEKDYKPKTA